MKAVEPSLIVYFFCCCCGIISMFEIAMIFDVVEIYENTNVASEIVT